MLSGEARYRLLLQVAEAANSSLDMTGVLEEVGRVLEPLVALDAIAIVTVDGAELRPHAIHIRGVAARQGETVPGSIARALDLSREEYEARYGRPIALAGSGTELVGRTGRAEVQ